MGRKRNAKRRATRVGANGSGDGGASTAETDNGGKSTPRRVQYEPWLVQHQKRMEEMREVIKNPAKTSHQHLGRAAGKEVLIFPDEPDRLPPEQYNAIVDKATKRLGLRDTYSPELPYLLIEHMANGGTLEAFCGLPEVGVSHDTFWKWIKKYAELHVAVKVGTALAQRYWEGVGGESMFLPDGVKFNMQAWVLVMKNRFGYKDKVTHEAEDGLVGGLPLLQQPYRNLDNLTVEELKQLETLLAKIEFDDNQGPPPPKQLN